MLNRLDSRSLFLAQINQHAEALGGLLSGAAQDPIDRELSKRCIVSTRMLSKSVSLMELSEWQTVLDVFQSLLEIYREKNLPWDERIADVTSGIIEKEDLLVTGAGAGGPSDLEGAVSTEELRALSREVSELVEFAAETPVTPESDDATVPGAGGTTGAGDPGAGRGEGDTGQDGRGSSDGVRVLEKGMAELRRHADALCEAWASSAAALHTSPALDDIRTHLLVIGFHGFSMERTLATGAGPHPAPLVNTLAPLRAAIEDHAVAASATRGRAIELAFSGEDRAIDARLLQPVHVVLQHLVSDVLLRCGQDNLRVEIGVEEKNGALHWTLKDNGENFVSDSHVDRDEYLAFYPGLREARKILGDLHSLLWVEPDGRAGTRFAFTIPPSLQDRSFMVWKNAGIAVLSSQISGLFRVGEVELTSDPHGERVLADGRWIPVLRLGQVCPEGPTDGDRIAVIGSLEKRVAFFVEGEGVLEKGVWKKDGGAVGRGMDGGTVRIGEARMALVEANGVLQKYMAIVDAVPEECVSGGVDQVVSDPSHTQATREKDAKTPPEISSKKGEVDVLVVEENEALRRTLGSILVENGLTTKTVGGLEAAMAFLDGGHPSVVISDFRVPTMAAKAIADRFRRDGKKIPVYVTTTHTGRNAEVLVKRLGVSGYIAKPVSGDDVLSRVVEHAGGRAGRTSRRSSGLAI